MIKSLKYIKWHGKKLGHQKVYIVTIKFCDCLKIKPILLLPKQCALI